jgi:tetratricopeptide (TPR) repeat protein
MKEGNMVLAENHEEDWDKILPVMIYGDEETAQTIYEDMERAIEKSSKVVERHTMEVSKRASKKMKRPEMNRWIDDNYLLIGQAYFYKRNYYKAEELFLYVTRKYKDPRILAQGYTWLGRVYIEREEWTRANNHLIKAAAQKELHENPDVEADIMMVHADYHLKQDELKEAAEKLEDALPLIKKKKDRARPTFILAQIYQEMGKSQKAINKYKEVVKLKPEYEMEFYSQINQALAFSRRGGNPQEIRDQLNKMLRDDKNIEYQDQIYYALAELELSERNREEGIANLNKSIEVNDGNQKQKAKTYLRLADLFFEERVYEKAQAYYDSTYKNIAEDHERFKEIENLATSLTELVTYLETIYREDSLQAICELPEAQRVKKAEEVRAQLEREAEEKRIAEEEALLAAIEAGGESGATSAGFFWPYNNTLRASGLTFFQDTWGDRPLEDNWRRRNKLTNTFDGDNPDDIEEKIDVETVKTDSDEIPTVDQLLDNLPCDNPGLMAASDEAITEAYYNTGVIYKEKLEDDDNAVEKWRELVTRFEDSGFHPTTFYQLYRIYLKLEQEGFTSMDPQSTSQYWAGRISEKYPGSEWDKLVQNPEYLDFKEVKEAEERAAYEAVYREYGFRQYVNVISTCTDVILNDPENHLLCKYRMLKAQSVGRMDAMVGLRDNYIAELQSIIIECPESEESSEAQRILDTLDGKVEEVPEPEKVESPFNFNPASKHYFACVFSTDRGNVNKVKANVADFNTKMFNSSGLKTSNSLLTKDNHVVLVKTFTAIEDAEDYYATFTSNTDELKEVNEAGYQMFIISKENYLTLFKNKDLSGYLDFFSNNYN